MGEFIFLFLLIIILPASFYVLGIDAQYLTYTVVVISCIIVIPFFKSLFTAPFVPSAKGRIETMLKLAGVSRSKRVWELGCGDGRILRKAAEVGAKELRGFEISLPLVWYGKLRAFLQRKNVQIQFQDFWKLDFSEVDVVMCYLIPQTMKRVEEKIWPQLPVGARLVSNAFALPNVEPDAKEEGVYLYIKKQKKSRS